jgi:3-keto-disaccharide hydrolase
MKLPNPIFWNACRRLLACCLIPVACWTAAFAAAVEPDGDGWISLFNGRDLDGWKASDNLDTFHVADGEIVIHGPTSHLFYVGPVGGADFTNFQWKCDVLMKPHSNSGMYFHTEYQDRGWPAKGYEVQLNNSHPDPKKTGGLYGIADVMNQSPVNDNEWFTQEVTVEGEHVVVRVNGKVTTDYTEPDHVERSAEFAGRLLSHGTVALQGHDPGSEVHVRNIMVKLLPSLTEPTQK